MDYLLPTALEVPRERVIEIREDHPSPLNPLGLKGGGEVGPGAAGALYANAVCDAFRDRHLNVTRLPLSPDNVRSAVAAAGIFVVSR